MVVWFWVIVGLRVLGLLCGLWAIWLVVRRGVVGGLLFVVCGVLLLLFAVCCLGGLIVLIFIFLLLVLYEFRV